VDAGLHNLTLWRFRHIAVALNTEECVLCVVLRYVSLPAINNVHCCTTVFLWLIYVGVSDLYLGLPVNLPAFLTACNQFWIFGQVFIKFLNIKFHGKLFGGTFRRPDGRDEANRRLSRL
jgi:hypothetical protein